VTLATALRLGRVSNLPTVWTNVLAGAVLADAPLRTGALVLTALACSLFYTGGMFLNDAFDRAFDARARPERPIPCGVVTASEVFVAGFGQLAAGLVLVVLSARWISGASGAALAAGLGLAGLIVVYDAWHKDNPIAPLLMGLCRVLVYVTAAVALTGTLSPAVVGGAGVLLAYLIGLTYVARHETIGSLRSLWPVIALAFPFTLWSLALRAGPVGIGVYVVAVAWTLVCVSHLGWRARVDVPRAVVGMIAGIALVDALALASWHQPGLALLAGAAFALTLVLQRWVAGT
jgi:4-hydroxybenzoate polyprenyltransferase